MFAIQNLLIVGGRYIEKLLNACEIISYQILEYNRKLMVFIKCLV